MALNAGDLDQRVTLQQAVETRDSGGGVEVTWQNLTTNPTVWAQVRPLSGREAYRARQVIATATHSVRIRNRSDVTPKMRVVHGSKVLNIEAVQDPDTRHEETVLICTEAV